MEERLQKIIARAGLASRRRAEEMIASGLVTVNGKIITEMGIKADPAKDHIKVGGKLLQFDSEMVYVLLNKPPEVVSTMSDPEGRRSLRDLLHGIPGRVFPVGRLEYHTAGLVLLTNDGDLANRILKSRHLPQTYQLKLKTLLTFEEIENLSRATGARISRIRGKDAPWYIVTLSDARRDVLRNKLFQTGHPVEKVKRVAIGNLDIGSLGPGHHRILSASEVASLTRSLDGTLPAANPAERKQTDRKSVGHMADGHGSPKRRNFARKPFIKKPFEDRSPMGKPPAPKSFERAPFGKDSAYKSFANKPYDDESPMEKPPARKSFERAPFGRKTYGDKGSANKPFDRKSPFKKFPARKFPPRKPTGKKFSPPSAPPGNSPRGPYRRPAPR